MRNVFSAITLLGGLVTLLAVLIFLCCMIFCPSEPPLWPLTMALFSLCLSLIAKVIGIIVNGSSDNDENDSIQ